ncbi:MAG TPA: DUF2628 domain-containing protein [Burkholderiaceae bacterium]|nr:DUF2628 domain-containing protein [Burkholderiaceae bacterium]
MAPELRHVVYFHRQRGTVKVKRGFCWSAFPFGSLGAFARRMWLRAVALLLVIEFLLWVLTGYAGAQRSAGLALLGLAATIAFAIIRGKYGNRWGEASLARPGYVLRPAASEGDR